MNSPNEPRTIPYMIRMDRELLEQFQTILPERGSVPQFIHSVMAEFIKLWGDRPSPQQVTMEAVQNVFRQLG